MSYSATDLRRFLEELDRNLTRPCELVVIGGAAGALMYGVTSATKDIDVWNARYDSDLVQALALTRQRLGLDVELAGAPVAHPPYEFEDRLVLLGGLSTLQVRIPERYDLVLLKIARCFAGDRAHIMEMHAHEPLDLELLVQRYLAEMLTAATDPDVLDDKLWIVVDDLFRTESADAIHARVKERRRGG